jgi:hypothetical protein
MIVNLREIEKKTTSANQYIDNLEQPIREILYKKTNICAEPKGNKPT